MASYRVFFTSEGEARLARILEKIDTFGFEQTMAYFNDMKQACYSLDEMPYRHKEVGKVPPENRVFFRAIVFLKNVVKLVLYFIVDDIIGRMNIDIRDLQIFYHIVEEKSFTVGAQSAGVSQTTATRAVKRLEQQAESMLIVREKGTGLFELTPEGKKLYLMWAGIGTNIQNVLPRTFSSRSTFEIQLSGPLALLSEILLVSNPFGPLSGIHSNADMKLTISEPDSFEEVRHSQILFTYTPEALPSRNDVIIRKICTLHLGLYGEKGYLKSRPSDEERTYFCVDDELTGQFHNLFGRTVVVSNGILIRDALLTGRGIGMAGSYCEPYRPHLKRIHPNMNLAAPIYMAFQKDTKMVPGVPELIKTLDNIFKLVIEESAIPKRKVASDSFLTAI